MRQRLIKTNYLLFIKKLYIHCRPLWLGSAMTFRTNFALLSSWHMIRATPPLPTLKLPHSAYATEKFTHPANKVFPASYPTNTIAVWSASLYRSYAQAPLELQDFLFTPQQRILPADMATMNKCSALGFFGCWPWLADVIIKSKGSSETSGNFYQNRGRHKVSS